MTTKSEKTASEISRQKYNELRKNIELLKASKSYKDVLFNPRLTMAELVLVIQKIQNALKLHGGILASSTYLFNHLQRHGIKSTLINAVQKIRSTHVLENGKDAHKKTATTIQQYSFEFKPDSEYKSIYETYLKVRNKKRNIAVFRAITGNYDTPLVYEHFLKNADYFTFTDSPVEVPGSNLLVPYFDISSTRRARYVKLHPHLLFPNYDVAVWHDGNVMLRDDISPLINKVLDSQLPVGSFLHPIRDNIYDEALACIKENKDSEEVILKQLGRYSNEGFLSNDLVESNFLIFNLKHPDLRNVMNKWWEEIDCGSLRDQLSFNYAVDTSNTSFTVISERPNCVRNNPVFEFFPNHGSQDRKPISQVYAEASVETFSEFPISFNAGVELKCDVLICVHNALIDVKLCLKSVMKIQSDIVQNIIIVDDGSDRETQIWLANFARNNANVILERHEIALGYTKAANKAVSLSSSDNIVLLNSDAIVGANSIKKMIRHLNNIEGCGIVGPLSNAASSQSIPDIRNTANQTAVNVLPKGMSVDDMDNWCSINSRDLQYPSVPLVHGFCFCIKKSVFEKIGCFDEESFPAGYGEENDLCIRASNAGFRLIVAIDTFVFHSKSKSYTNKTRRAKLLQSGNEKLANLYGKERISRLVLSMQLNPTLVKMRDRSLELFNK